MSGYEWIDRHGRGYPDLLRPDRSILCTLTEPEDRTPCRDLSPIVDELNKLAAERDAATARAEVAERRLDILRAASLRTRSALEEG